MGKQQQKNWTEQSNGGNRCFHENVEIIITRALTKVLITEGNEENIPLEMIIRKIAARVIVCVCVCV